MALKEGDEAEIDRLGVVEEPPAIRSFRDLKRDKPRDSQTKGDFKPIARLHRAIEKKFVYDPNIGRFTPKDPLGPAAETLDALHDAKAKAEKDKTYEKMASGDPEEAMQAAIDFGGVFAKLSDGILNPKTADPQLQDARPGGQAPPDRPRAGPGPGLRHATAKPGTACSSAPSRPSRPTARSSSRRPRSPPRSRTSSPPAATRPRPSASSSSGSRWTPSTPSGRSSPPGGSPPASPDQPEDEEGPEPEMPPEPAKPSPGEIPDLARPQHRRAARRSIPK